MENLKEIPNSFYASIFDRSKSALNLPPEYVMNNLGSISALYLYSNPPPMGYGTPAPKAAATVIRTLEYNRKPSNKVIRSGKYLIDNTMWENEGPYPYHQVTSNFHPGVVHEMGVNMLIKNMASIKRCAEDVINRAMSQNSDILTKGKQTWCPLTETSLPCPQAYMNMCDWMSLNGKPKKHTLLEFLMYFFELMESKNLIIKKVTHEYSTKTRNIDHQQLKVRKKMKRVKTLQGNTENFDYCMDLARSFCSYLKHGERAHLDRRAICSANVIMRAIFHIIEEFHLELGKCLDGSTISIGGEEKKNKIIYTMNKASMDTQYTQVLQATEDQTKWNECLSGGGFNLFSQTLFDDDTRKKCQLPLMSKIEKVMSKLCKVGHYLLCVKMVAIGNGLQGKTSIYHGEISWNDCESKLNRKSLEWFKKIKPHLYGNCYVQSSGGMLMGMHNALSTSYGLLPSHWAVPLGSVVNTLRSSDDSMTMFSAQDTALLSIAIDGQRLGHKLAAMNHSPEKTFFFGIRYGEYTSWFQDDKMVCQFGTETTKLRPGGNNPPDDFYGIVKSTAVSQMNLESNAIGSEAKIRLGVSNVRNLYRIKRKEGRADDDLSVKVRVLSDGGLNPWNCMNCHLEETSLKEYYVRTEKEKQYFLKIRNPGNPFIGDPKEQITWNRDLGTLAIDHVDTPMTIFHTVKRGNRSIINVKGPTHEASERENAQALKLVNMADVSTLLRVPQCGISMSNHMISSMLANASMLDLTADDVQLINDAINVLQNGHNRQEDDDYVYDSD